MGEGDIKGYSRGTGSTGRYTGYFGGYGTVWVRVGMGGAGSGWMERRVAIDRRRSGVWCEWSEEMKNEGRVAIDRETVGVLGEGYAQGGYDAQVD